MTKIKKRPELMQGTYDLLAGDNYTARIPQPPNYTFVIDISKASSSNFVPYYAFSAIKEFLTQQVENEDTAMTFSIVLYDRFLHYVKFAPESQTPMIITVDPETLEPTFNLQLSDFTTYLADIDVEVLSNKLDILIEDLQDSSTELTPEWPKLKSILYKIGVQVRKTGGMISWIHGSGGAFVPKLSNKDATKRGFYNCNDSDMHKISGEMHRSFAWLDAFVFGLGSNKNVSSLGEMIRLNGGDFNLYRDATEGQLVRFYNDILHALGKAKTWETVFRVRVSKGWNKHPYGNYFASNFSDLLKMQTADENYSVYFKLLPNAKKTVNQQANYFFIQVDISSFIDFFIYLEYYIK